MGANFEDKNQLFEARKYFLRFLACAKMLEDRVGTALALNRLGVVYFKLGNYEKSIKCH